MTERTMTVRELVMLLLEFPMDTHVYINEPANDDFRATVLTGEHKFYKLGNVPQMWLEVTTDD